MVDSLLSIQARSHYSHRIVESASLDLLRRRLNESSIVKIKSRYVNTAISSTATTTPRTPLAPLPTPAYRSILHCQSRNVTWLRIAAFYLREYAYLRFLQS